MSTERLYRLARGRPIVNYLVGCLIDGARSTLLSICPNSEAVTRAAVLAAREAGAPLLLSATLNQVDVDRGNTGWTQQTLIDFLDAEASAARYDGPVLVRLDHGGPWLKDQHFTDALSVDETLRAVKTSLEASVNAGYALLHVDATVDRSLEGPPPIELVVERTVDLIDHVETHRRLLGIPPIAYEVGTEEVKGGLVDLPTFQRFLSELHGRMDARGLLDAWPAFVVGKVGTDLHTTHFSPEAARRLTEEVRPLGSLIKGHYTDYVENPRAYPLSGMGGANVGPEFTDAEFAALMELQDLSDDIGRSVDLRAVLREALVASGRWRKWLARAEEGSAFDELAPDRRGWLLRTGSRYVWKNPDVEAARRELYGNVADACDPDAFVLWRIKTAMLRYYHAFNQIGFLDKIAS